MATETILAESAGSTFPNIPAEKLEALRVVLPPLPEQKRIAEILNEQMATAEKLQGGLEEQLDEINALPATLLRRASPEDCDGDDRENRGSLRATY